MPNNQEEGVMSPTPHKVTVVNEDEQQIDFFQALAQVVLGKKMHKLEWEDKEFYGYLKDEVLLLHKPDGKDYQWILSESDMTGTDYIIL